MAALAREVARYSRKSIRVVFFKIYPSSFRPLDLAEDADLFQWGQENLAPN
jgi:hypothetical protein